MDPCNVQGRTSGFAYFGGQILQVGEGADDPPRYIPSRDYQGRQTSSDFKDATEAGQLPGQHQRYGYVGYFGFINLFFFLV